MDGASCDTIEPVEKCWVNFGWIRYRGATGEKHWLWCFGGDGGVWRDGGDNGYEWWWMDECCFCNVSIPDNGVSDGDELRADTEDDDADGLNAGLSLSFFVCTLLFSFSLEPILSALPTLASSP